MSTKIEWCSETWNPITGCTPISPGCLNCYARRMAYRLKGRYGYPADDPFRVTFHEDRLGQPAKWRKPRHIFVCSMGDLFHDDVPQEWIDRIFRFIGFEAIHHRFLILTKRPDRMFDYYKRLQTVATHPLNPYPNVWLGVTVCNQQEADEKIPILLQIPAAVRFVSIEPMLSKIDFRWTPYHHQATGETYRQYLTRKGGTNQYESLKQIDWVIVGGESGPGARPMHPDWVRHVRDQCQVSGTKFFFKQWGEWMPYSQRTTKDQVILCEREQRLRRQTYFGYRIVAGPGGKPITGTTPDIPPELIARIGKKKAGRLLDGREWNELPGVEKE